MEGLKYSINFKNNGFCGSVFLQLKAKTEMLLSAEAAKAAQKANLENNLETAQHALQDKQQVGFFFLLLNVMLCMTLTDVFFLLLPAFTHFPPLVSCTLSHCLVKELNKVQKKVEEQAQRLKERQEQGTQLEASLKESKDKRMASEQRIEQLEGLNKVCVEFMMLDCRAVNLMKLPFHTCSTQQEIVSVRNILTYWKYCLP